MPQKSSAVSPALAHLVSSIFYAIALLLLYLGTQTMVEVQNAKEWVQVPARTVGAGIDVQNNAGKKEAPHQRLAGAYVYTWEGKEYRGERIEFSKGSNNFSQVRQARQWAQLRSGSFAVHVDPSNPSQSVLDPSLPAPLMAFYAAFLVFPCFLGVVWFWSMPLMLVRNGERAPALEKVLGWGTMATLLYLPTACIVLFANQLGGMQWLVFAVVYTVVLGARWALRKAVVATLPKPTLR